MLQIDNLGHKFGCWGSLIHKNSWCDLCVLVFDTIWPLISTDHYHRFLTTLRDPPPRVGKRPELLWVFSATFPKAEALKWSQFCIKCCDYAHFKDCSLFHFNEKSWKGQNMLLKIVPIKPQRPEIFNSSKGMSRNCGIFVLFEICYSSRLEW